MKGGCGTQRSESVRERTKIRERIRRAISSKIFNGIRKHGRYGLSNRCDTNTILRQLANEASFVIEPDGTTYLPLDFIKCPLCGLCGAVNTISKDTTITNNEKSMVMGGVVNCSMTSFPLVGGVNTNSIRYPARSMAIANNDHGTNNVGYYSPLAGSDGSSLLSVYVSEDQVALEGGSDGSRYGLGEYDVSITMGNNGIGSGMENEEMEHQKVLHFEEGVNKCNPNPDHIHNDMVGCMCGPFF